MIVTLRRALPFGLRSSLLRLPAIASWALARRGRPAPASESGFAHLQCDRSSPLRRPGAEYSERLQAGKERNVGLGARLLHPVVLAPGESFSWHERVGPPIRLRGFRPGPEVHGQALTEGYGGGLCQLANMVYWLAVHSGMTILERHGHALDLFPDHERDAPFGCGATVFYPTRDLRFSNPLDQPARFELTLRDGRLSGRVRLARDPRLRWAVKESGARFVRAEDGPWRENALYRVRAAPDGSASEELLSTNRAKVLYAI